MEMYGYGRISDKRFQTPERQIQSLLEYGVPKENIYIDRQSGKNFDRPAYQELKSKLKEGSTLVFHELDRMGRNYDEGMEEVNWFRKMNIKLVFLDYLWLNQMTESDDVIVRANGYNMLSMQLAIAETERRKLLKRQKEGIAIARKNNPEKYCGRPKEYNWVQVKDAMTKYHSGEYTVKEACSVSGMSRATFYRYLKKLED